MCLYVCLHVYMSYIHGSPPRPKIQIPLGIRFLWGWNYRLLWALQYKRWQPNSSFLKSQVLLTTEPSLQFWAYLVYGPTWTLNVFSTLNNKYVIRILDTLNVVKCIHNGTGYWLHTKLNSVLIEHRGCKTGCLWDTENLAQTYLST